MFQNYGNGGMTPVRRQSVPGPSVQMPGAVTPPTYGPMRGSKPVKNAAQRAQMAQGAQARRQAQGQQTQGVDGSAGGPTGIPFALRNGRMAFKQADGSYLDENGRQIQ